MSFNELQGGPPKVQIGIPTQIAHSLKLVGIPLFATTTIGLTLDQWITAKMESQLMNPQGAGSLVWIFAAFSILLNILYPLTLMLLLMSSLPQKQTTTQSTKDFLMRFFSQTLIEQLRAWGKGMLWSFALILPGIMYFIRYTFVPFIVCFDPQYAEGKVDALKRSLELTKGKFFHLSFLYLFFVLVIPGFLTAVDEYKIIWKTPAASLVITFFEMLTNVVFILLLIQIYNKQNFKFKS